MLVKELFVARQICVGNRVHTDDIKADALFACAQNETQNLVVYAGIIAKIAVSSPSLIPAEMKEQEGYFHLLSKRNRLLAKMVCRTPGLFALTYRLYEKLFRREEEH